MARIKLPDGPGTERQRLMSLRPELAAGVDHFSGVIYDTTLPLRLFECVRGRIAIINQCPN
jgi:hypothetical protein